MNHPNMTSEIIEAIHFMYEDNPELEVDCYLCLAASEIDSKLAMKLSDAAQVAIEEMGRCAICGCKMEKYSYKEFHPELEDNSYEIVTDVYCPHCDRIEWR